MNRVSNESHSIKYEVREVLNHNNAVRAFVSSIFLAFLFGIFICVVNVGGIYSEKSLGLTVFLAVSSGISVILAVLGYLLVKNNEKDRMIIFYRSVFVVHGILILVCAGLDLSISGSMILTVACGVYMSLVPVLSGVERRIYLAVYAVGIVATVLISNIAGRVIAEGIIIAVVMFIIGDILQENAISYERMSFKLKAKTISSESDPLTGLNNRRGLNRKASVLWPYCMESNTEIGLIEIDVDFFKKYNDRFGHPAGDKCLKMIADAIREAVGSSRCITARTGGEEFVVFVQGLNEEQLIELALNIRNTVDELQIVHAYAGVSKYVTVSMGVSTIVPIFDNSFQDLYEAADKALYSAKSNGRHCIVCGDKIYGRMRKGLASIIS